MEELLPGTLIDHPKFGIGVIARVKLTSYEVFFERGGKYEFPKSTTDLKIIEKPNVSEEIKNTFSLKEIEEVITYIFEKYDALQQKVKLGDKWTGGTLILKPKNPALQAKEIPIETFFHKIVMIRDRLRVLEQHINSNSKLTDEEKIDLQQYITRCYGTLTSFNLLFRDKEDYFVGMSSKEK